jgi:site-specific recombinase XerD
VKSESSNTTVEPKSRLNPIRSTIESIRGYPTTLVIYKSPASRFYWVRFYFAGRYRIKTTKTENKVDAKKFAQQFYKDTLLDSSVTLKSNKENTFAVIGNLYFSSTEKNTNPSTYKSDYNRYQQHLLPYFKQQELDSISNAQINQFVEELRKTGIKPATIKHHIVILRKVLKFAIANDQMRTLPVFPRITGKLQTSQKRDYLTKDEYELIVKTAEDLADSGKKVRTHFITLQMKYLIQFMVNSFIRPSDLRVLKHRHVKIMKDKEEEWLSLSHPATKTNANEVQAMPATVGIYRKLIEQLKSERLSVRPDDYLFFPNIENRDTAMEVISRQFKEIVDASLIEESTDKKIVLYSLRHTAIMFRLIIGSVDTLVLSRNARTSQSMIDRFYAAHLTTDQVRRQLHHIPYAEDQTTVEREDLSKTPKSSKSKTPPKSQKSSAKGETASKTASQKKSSADSDSDTEKSSSSASKQVRTRSKSVQKVAK